MKSETLRPLFWRNKSLNAHNVLSEISKNIFAERGEFWIRKNNLFRLQILVKVYNLGKSIDKRSAQSVLPTEAEKSTNFEVCDRNLKTQFIDFLVVHHG